MTTDFQRQLQTLRFAPQVELLEVATGQVLISRLTLAVTFGRRFVGWQFRRPAGIDEGLLLAPCRSIHTHWMRFSLDIVSLDAQGFVLEIATAVRPWRWYRGPQGAFATLELATAGAAGRLAAGTQVTVRAAA